MEKVPFSMPIDDSLWMSIFNVHDSDERKAYAALGAIYGKRTVIVLKKFIKEIGGIMGLWRHLPGYPELSAEVRNYFAVSIVKAMEVRRAKKKIL